MQYMQYMQYILHRQHILYRQHMLLLRTLSVTDELTDSLTDSLTYWITPRFKSVSSSRSVFFFAALPAKAIRLPAKPINFVPVREPAKTTLQNWKLFAALHFSSKGP